MNEIQILENLKQDFQKLTYENHDKQEGLSIRFKTVTRRLLGDNTEHIDSFDRISFTPGIISIDGSSNRARFKESWERGHKRALSLIDAVIEDAKLFADITETRINAKSANENSKSKVFIVHGHDNEAKVEVARFVERLGLDAVILHEQANSGATIIEKLEKHTDVGFAIVLYTPCDIGSVKTDLDNLKPRARQNVVFEHGLLIGKIGRNNVVALVKETVEIPNDISGMVYETMDDKGAWKYQVARELKESGYAIDMNLIC